MTDLFQHAEAKAAKAAGMRQSEENASERWSKFMLEQVRLTALEQRRFTADDVFDRAELIPDAPQTHDLRAFGPVMMQAAKRNYCQKADCAPVASRRKSLHASPRAVWDSKLFRR